jgi:hypothetical protein
MDLSGDMLPQKIFEIKEGKNTQKVKKITIINHYLLDGDSNGRRARVSPRIPLPQKIFENYQYILMV